MNVLFISLYSNPDICIGSGRLGNIISKLGPNNQYTVLTTNFNHRTKQYHKLDYSNDRNIKYYYFPVPSYKKNLSIRRILSHLVFSNQVYHFLKGTNDIYDIVYCVVPLSSAVLACKHYKEKTHCKLIIDVMDLWPSSLLPVYKNNHIINALLYPWQILTNKSYKLADYISSESKLYGNIAHHENPSVPWSYTYLGINKSEYRQLLSRSKVFLPSTNKVRLCYGGSLGNSYDFEGILSALKFIQEKGILYEMYFVGGGDNYNLINDYIIKYDLNAYITGVVAYEDYLKYLSYCDIAFNSFRADTKVVHSYKFNDYVVSGLYILNNLRGETEDMVSDYDIGITYDNTQLGSILYEVCRNWDYYKGKKNNCTILLDKELDADVIYANLADDILKL